jgi:hypothetical protein
VVSWKDTKFEEVIIKRLPGLSNACYRVETSDKQCPVILYRKFECKIVNKNVEALIFRVASEQKIGPELLF